LGIHPRTGEIGGRGRDFPVIAQRCFVDVDDGGEKRVTGFDRCWFPFLSRTRFLRSVDDRGRLPSRQIIRR
jgi:hypothetical protein